MAQLPQAQQDVVVWIEQRYTQNRLWWSNADRLGNLQRMLDFYTALGITRLQARQWEAAVTAADGGWMAHNIPQAQAQAVMHLIFNEAY